MYYTTFCVSDNSSTKEELPSYCSAAVDQWHEQGKSMPYNDAEVVSIPTDEYTLVKARIIWKETAYIYPSIGLDEKNKTCLSIAMITRYDPTWNATKSLSDNIITKPATM